MALALDRLTARGLPAADPRWGGWSPTRRSPSAGFETLKATSSVSSRTTKQRSRRSTSASGGRLRVVPGSLADFGHPRGTRSTFGWDPPHV